MDSAIITKEALRLPETERALLADTLLSSLSETSGELKQSWIDEAEDRMAAFREGRIQAIDGAAAITDLKARFAK